MPLLFAPIKQAVKIVKIATDDATKKHLADLGLTVGAEITLFSSSGGSVVCFVRQSKLALDGRVAARIFVA